MRLAESVGRAMKRFLIFLLLGPMLGFLVFLLRNVFAGKIVGGFTGFVFGLPFAYLFGLPIVLNARNAVTLCCSNIPLSPCRPGSPSDCSGSMRQSKAVSVGASFIRETILPLRLLSANQVLCSGGVLICDFFMNEQYRWSHACDLGHVTL